MCEKNFCYSREKKENKRLIWFKPENNLNQTLPTQKILTVFVNFRLKFLNFSLKFMKLLLLILFLLNYFSIKFSLFLNKQSIKQIINNK